jgi:hypothetical protein
MLDNWLYHRTLRFVSAQEKMESLIMDEVAKGAGLPDLYLYPMNAETKLRCEAWENGK